MSGGGLGASGGEDGHQLDVKASSDWVGADKADTKERRAEWHQGVKPADVST